LFALAAKGELLEIGFGPGLAIEQASQWAPRGKVAGIDHSKLMLR